MRLLHTTKLKVGEFTKPPKYATLSHTWDEEEITFQDMQADLPVQKKGFSKIRGICAQAKKDGFDYIWVDTCCIDKSSSAELSEAINSMYRWYEEGKVCYTYLSDVPSQNVENPRQPGSRFRRSRWFTRGWTLQELIAPPKLIFLSECWSKLGSKMEFIEVLSAITGIDSLVLQGKYDLSAASAARKMSWASKRITTRLEDRAYSLLGIFDVNMPLLYGEGQKAFIRLQEEILRQRNDESLFAHQNLTGNPRTERLLLAHSPDSFSQSADILLYSRDTRLHDQVDLDNAPSLLTNTGIQIQSFGAPCTYRSASQTSPVIDGWLMILNCRLLDDVLARPAVFLEALDPEKTRFARYASGSLLIIRQANGSFTIDERFRGPRGIFRGSDNHEFIPKFAELQRRTIFVGPDSLGKKDLVRPCIWLKDIIQPKERNFVLTEGWPKWNAHDKSLSEHPYLAKDKLHGALLFHDVESKQRLMVIIDLTIQNLGPDQKGPFRFGWCYKTNCTIVELDYTDRASYPLFEAVMASLALEAQYWTDYTTFVYDKPVRAVAAIKGWFYVRATLSLEEFLERKEFTLSVEIVESRNTGQWHSLREKRQKLFSESYEKRLGYATSFSGKVSIGTGTDDVEMSDLDF